MPRNHLSLDLTILKRVIFIIMNMSHYTLPLSEVYHPQKCSSFLSEHIVEEPKNSQTHFLWLELCVSCHSSAEPTRRSSLSKVVSSQLLMA